MPLGSLWLFICKPHEWYVNISDFDSCRFLDGYVRSFRALSIMLATKDTCSSVTGTKQNMTLDRVEIKRFLGLSGTALHEWHRWF